MARSARLLTHYRVLAKQDRPGWALPIEPSIPFFVEAKFPARGGLLMYGSSESLWTYADKYPPELLDDRAWNRHRYYYDLWKARTLPKPPFPDVHIEPFKEGGLLVAAAFLTTLTGGVVPEDRSAFIETIALGNFGKYGWTKDYADQIDKLTASLPFVEMDLQVLQPSTVLVVNAMVRTLRANKSTVFDSLAHLVPVRQCVFLARSHCVKDHQADVQQLQEQYGSCSWVQWIADIESEYMRRTIWHYLADVRQGWVEGISRR